MTVTTTGANTTASALGVAAAAPQTSADGSAVFAQALSSAAGLAAGAAAVASGVVAAPGVVSTLGAAPTQSVAEVPASKPHDRETDPAVDLAAAAVTIAIQSAAISAIPIVDSTQSPTPSLPNEVPQTTTPNVTTQSVTSPASTRMSTPAALAPDATSAPSTTTLTNPIPAPNATEPESSSQARTPLAQSTDNGTLPLAPASLSVLDDHLLGSVVSATMSTGDPVEVASNPVVGQLQPAFGGDPPPSELTAQVGATVEQQLTHMSSDATAVTGRVDVKLGVANRSVTHEATTAVQSPDDTGVQPPLVRTVPEKSFSENGKRDISSTETAADTPSATAPTIPGQVRAQHASGTHVATSAVVPAATGQSNSTDAAEVAHQIGRHIASTRLSGLARERPMHLSVLLHPEDLGEVAVQLTLVAGRIDVQVSSQSDTTRDMLRQGMQDLRRQLSDSGVAVGDTDVHDGWSQQQNSSQNDQRTADQRSSQQPRLPGLPAPSSSRMTTPEPTVVHRQSRTGLDILA